MQVCEKYEARISALIDDELPAGERMEVLEHLAQCPACKTYWEELLLIRDALRAPEKAPAGFADAVMVRVRATAQERKTLRFPGWKRFAGLAACCALVLLGVWAMDLAPNLAGGGADNCAAPQMFAMDEDLMTGSTENCGLDTADSAEPEATNGAAYGYDKLPGSSRETDDEKTGDNGVSSAAVLTTDSAVAAKWVEDTLGEAWVSGARYSLSEEQYGELRGLLEDAGEGFNEIMGEKDSGSYELLAE